jgi:hypothetical protein
MKKDAVYSMRMSTRVRDALKFAAVKERRTVASLLDKIITDYLANEGYLSGPEFGTERRKFMRKPIRMAAKSVLNLGSEEESFPSVILDISLGGVLLTYPKGSEVSFASVGKLPDFKLCLDIPHENQPLYLDCHTRHMRETGNEIQVGASFNDPDRHCLEKLTHYI